MNGGPGRFDRPCLPGGWPIPIKIMSSEKRKLGGLYINFSLGGGECIYGLERLVNRVRR